MITHSFARRSQIIRSIKDDADYLKTLEALPRHLRQAFLEGDWNVFAGQYFDIFDVRRHAIRTERIGLEAWWPRWISVDWGYEHPSAVYWHTMRPDGVVVTYREYVVNHKTPNDLAVEILDRNRGEKIAAVYLSPDAFARHSSPSTIADQLGEVLTEQGLPQPIPADDDRVGGWMLMYQMLQDDKWVIADSCPQLIDCLPTLVRDPVNVEDVQKMAGDDPADSARYGLKSRLPSARPPIEARVAERVSAANLTSRHIWTQKFMAEERRASRFPKFPHRQWNSPR